jgi:hypothetical protein
MCFDWELIWIFWGKAGDRGNPEVLNRGRTMAAAIVGEQVSDEAKQVWRQE